MIIYALISALIWLAVTLLSHGYLETGGFFFDLPNGQMPFGRFFILYVLAFILYLITVIKVSRLPADRRNIFIVISGAIVFRLILLPGIPVHENDIYRYIWDGKVSNAGINPYKYPPIQASIRPGISDLRSMSDSSALETGLKPVSTVISSDFEKLKKTRDDNSKFYRRISFKDIPTVYPPFAQAVFTLSTLIAPGSIFFMKFLFVLFDTAVIFLLYMILKEMKQNPLYVVVYAWNPLVLKEFANSGHYDSLAICCVMLAVYLMLKKRYIFSSISLGLGVLSKFYPIIFIPFFLIKKQYKAVPVSLAVIGAGYLPFFIWGKTGLRSVFAGFGTYTREWANNGFIFSIIPALTAIFVYDPYILSRILCGTIFVIIWIFIYFNKQDLPGKMFWAVTAVFLLSPVGAPWYFCWIIPFLCVYRRFSLIALSGLLILHYFIFTRDFGAVHIGSFKIVNLLLMQYVPFFLFFIIEGRFKYGIYSKLNHMKPKSL